MRLLATLLLLLPTVVLAQDAPQIFEVVEQEPELIGGIAGLQRRVTYPEMARRAGIEGTVYIQFVVDETGAVSQAVCARSPNELLCESSLRAVRESQFRPGYQEGQPVKVRFTLPIRYRLGDPAPSSVLQYAMERLGTTWNPVAATRAIGAPRSGGEFKAGTSTVLYADTDSAVESVSLWVDGWRLLRAEATFADLDALRQRYDAMVEASGEPADNGTFSPEQLGEPMRVTVDLARGRFVAEAAADPDGPPDGIYGVDGWPLDTEPVLEGGIARLQSNVLYPPQARMAGVQGTVYVQFVVDESGLPTDVRVAHGIDRDALNGSRLDAAQQLEEAAMQAVRRARFSPGRVDGRAVRVLFTVPIRFRLN